jgi:hypothetical protein
MGSVLENSAGNYRETSIMVTESRAKVNIGHSRGTTLDVVQKVSLSFRPQGEILLLTQISQSLRSFEMTNMAHRTISTLVSDAGSKQ